MVQQLLTSQEGPNSIEVISYLAVVELCALLLLIQHTSGSKFGLEAGNSNVSVGLLSLSPNTERHA